MLDSIRSLFGDLLRTFSRTHVARLAVAIGWIGSSFLGAGSALSDDRAIDFVRDVQPILANHCWSCHGPDEAGRQADLRLDLREAAIASQSIVPGKSADSKILHRIHETDPERVMPPPETKKPLTDAQREVLQRWIDGGAGYSKHWSLEPALRREPPAISIDQQTHWKPTFPDGELSPIDRFVAERWIGEGVSPSPRANRETLLRRVYLDLTGLPPTLEEQQAFLGDSSDNALEKLIDRLLASSAYAERMAAQWLDLARYADTNGYNNDEDRSMWPWRDWVIRAFEANMPFDQFAIEQLAGDLLPNPTLEQRVATGFLRNQGHNTEGGIIAEEYRVEYVADRVHTVATVFLGLSMQCARCHDHKYDPISQNEYYQFFAFLNNLEEKQASYSNFVAAEPFVRVPSKDQSQRVEQLQREIDALQEQMQRCEEAAPETLTKWLQTASEEELASRWQIRQVHRVAFDQAPSEVGNEPILGLDAIHPEIAAKVNGPWSVVEGHHGQAVALGGATHVEFGELGKLNENQPFAISVWVQPKSTQGMAILSKMDEANHFRGYDLLLEGGKVAMHIVHRWPDNAIKVSTQTAITSDAWHHIVVSYEGSRSADGLKIFVDGQLAKIDVHANKLTDTIATDQPFRLGLRQKSLPFQGSIDDLQIWEGPIQPHHVGSLAKSEVPVAVTDWVRRPWSELTPEQQSFLKQFTLQQLDREYPALQSQRQDKQKERDAIEGQYPAVMVMKDMNPARETFVLKRGQYDQPGERVAANVPSALRAFSSEQPTNRLELARWLMHPDHPLTSRVVANRVWESLFGSGLVKTSEDFGVTGEFPSHPELLDYLAKSLVESGWNLKQLYKQILLSGTYQQDSRITRDMQARDPENRLLARGPRYRLSAESIRDNALAIGGLLKRTIGGPSVKPYQPDGLWEDVTVERRGKYVADQGDGLFRRSMYTFWKRTCPPPSMVTFDAPNREVCVARRSRTNTPLQALVLLNDPTYIEAARALAQDTLKHGGESDVARIHYAYRRALVREARSEEIQPWLELVQAARGRFGDNAQFTESFNRVGTVPPASELPQSELAAWTVFASALLNLDETITKR
ncbi:MAG: DUF1553 domain-containing protein [Pirellula sp.]